ncbi:hypothetical protein CDAR_468441 [Caerostris darwini]|uniref:Uncharacterized protein n=1 Tax=Caerostris darwini TaxID=1538125 RepID=A0AAV4Q673_9ARAC|nr:hypothetical protein CDAR_468441 [Caerostris darwini]
MTKTSGVPATVNINCLKQSSSPRGEIKLFSRADGFIPPWRSFRFQREQEIGFTPEFVIMSPTEIPSYRNKNDLLLTIPDNYWFSVAFYRLVAKQQILFAMSRFSRNPPLMTHDHYVVGTVSLKKEPRKTTGIP